MLFVAFIALLTIAAGAAAAMACGRRDRPEALLTAFPAVLVGYSAVIFTLNQFAGVPITLPLVLAVSGAIAALLSAAALLTVGPPSKWWDIMRTSGLALWPGRVTGPAAFLEKLLAVGVGIIVLTVFLCAPISGDNYFYHLPIAQFILRNHTLPTQVSLSYQEMTNAYPPALFIFYASTWLALGREALWVPEITSLLFGIGILFFTYRMTRRFIADDEASAVLAALLLMSFYSVAYVLVSTSTDTMYNFFSIAGLFFLLDYFEKRRASSLALSAILEAFGCWSKYQVIMFIVALGIVWLGFWLASATFLRKRRGDLTFPIGGALVWGVGILAIFAPFALRNFERFGNPVYPALPMLFGGRDVNDWTLSWLLASKQILPYIPNQITVSHATNLLFFAGAFLIPAALGYAAPRAKSAYSYLLASSVLFGVLWYKVLAAPETGDSFRFLIPALAVISCLSAPLLVRLLFDESEAKPRLNLLVLLCLVNAFLLFIDLGMYGFSSREFVFNVSEKLGMLGTFINYMLKFSKYHHFVIFLVGTALLVGLSSLRGHPDYARSGRRYRRLVATLMILSLLLYPFVRLIGTVNVAVHDGISLEVVNSSNLSPVVAAYLANRLPKDAKVLTFFTLKYLVPCTVVPADGEAVREPVRGEVHGIFDTRSPDRKFYEGEPRDQYTDADVLSALTVLKREGVTHILLDSIVDSQDVFLKSPIFTNVEHDPRYFKLRAWGSVAEGRFISLYEVAYPPDLDARGR